MVETTTPPPAPTGAQIRSGLRKAARWIGIPIAAMFVLYAIAAVVTGVWARDEMAAINDDLGSTPHPPEAVVCDGPADRVCAEDAARRAGRAVAWLADEGTVRSDALAVYQRPGDELPVDAGSVWQNLRDDRVHLELSTHPLDDRTLDGGVEIGEDATLHRDDENDNGATIEWTHQGERYRLSAFLLSLDDEQELVERTALAAFETIRYAPPPPE